MIREALGEPLALRQEALVAARPRRRVPGLRRGPAARLRPLAGDDLQPRAAPRSGGAGGQRRARGLGGAPRLRPDPRQAGGVGGGPPAGACPASPRPHRVPHRGDRDHPAALPPAPRRARVPDGRAPHRAARRAAGAGTGAGSGGRGGPRASRRRRSWPPRASPPRRPSTCPHDAFEVAEREGRGWRLAGRALAQGREPT